MMSAKKISIAAALALCLCAGAFGQQITRVAVMDFNKVIAARSKDAPSLKDFELKKSLIQAEIERRADEVMRLLAQKVEAEKIGDGKAAAKLKEEIDAKKRQLSEYATVKQKELDDEARALASNDAFVQALYKQVQAIAEADGYSLVLNIRSGDAVMGSVFWYSQMIDITDKLIQSLGAMSP
jgi:Skp family chaperone for outer membrane proteins